MRWPGLADLDDFDGFVQKESAAYDAARRRAEELERARKKNAEERSRVERRAGERRIALNRTLIRDALRVVEACTDKGIQEDAVQRRMFGARRLGWYLSIERGHYDSPADGSVGDGLYAAAMSRMLYGVILSREGVLYRIDASIKNAINRRAIDVLATGRPVVVQVQTDEEFVEYRRLLVQFALRNGLVLASES